MDDQQGLTYSTYLHTDLHSAHGALLSVMWPPGWEGVYRRRGPCICKAESLCCSSETVTTCLLIGYTPGQNKNFLKMNRLGKTYPLGFSLSQQ